MAGVTIPRNNNMKELSMRIKLSNQVVAKLKKRALRISRETKVCLSDVRDAVAQEAGYGTWRDLATGFNRRHLSLVPPCDTSGQHVPSPASLTSLRKAKKDVPTAARRNDGNRGHRVSAFEHPLAGGYTDAFGRKGYPLSPNEEYARLVTMALQYRTLGEWRNSTRKHHRSEYCHAKTRGLLRELKRLQKVYWTEVSARSIVAPRVPVWVNLNQQIGLYVSTFAAFTFLGGTLRWTHERKASKSRSSSWAGCPGPLKGATGFTFSK